MGHPLVKPRPIPRPHQHRPRTPRNRRQPPTRKGRAMTDQYELVGSIRRALTTIADHYDMALIPATRPAMKLPTTPSPEAKIKYAPKGMKEAPAPTSLDALDARADTSRDLRYWVGFIYDEIRDHNDDHIRTLVDGDNVRSM